MSSDQAEPPSLAFPRARRLTRPSEFMQVKNEGTAHRGRLLILGLLEKGGDGEFRVGFVTSKRVGSAVIRNRTRRRLREVVRRHQHAIKGHLWMVLIARPAAARARYVALEDEWLRLAKRALILAPSCS